MLHQDENTGLIVDDEGRTEDVRPGHHERPVPTREGAEALANWARTFAPRYVKDEFKGAKGISWDGSSSPS
jgi:hypothetical protein